MVNIELLPQMPFQQWDLPKRQYLSQYPCCTLLDVVGHCSHWHIRWRI